jgi:uncharacterized protein YcaQ
MRVMERLGSLQFDPLDVAGRNHDVVLLARIDGYRRAMTDGLLYEDRVLYETYNKGLSLVPTADLPWFRITWDRNRREHGDTAFREHAALVDELLDRIRSDGPLSSTDVAPRAAIEWYWRPTNQVRAILEALAEAGILGLARREGNRRVYDLVERLFPPDLLAERRTEDEQRRHKLLSRYRAHGLLGRVGGQAEVFLGCGAAAQRRQHRDELIEAGRIVPVTVEDVGERYILAEERPILDAARAAGSDGPAAAVTLLAPLDPIVWDRDLLRSLWDFDYIWEVYVPAARRRWGYYVLPVLFGDRFVGRIEPRFDRRAGRLVVIDAWWEDGVDPLAEPGLIDGLADALRAHAGFGDVERIDLPRATRRRPWVPALRAALRAATVRS